MPEPIASAATTGVVGAPTLLDFLTLVAERGGTDLHVTADSPPMMRIHGVLRPLPFPPLSANDTKTLCDSARHSRAVR